MDAYGDGESSEGFIIFLFGCGSGQTILFYKFYLILEENNEENIFSVLYTQIMSNVPDDENIFDETENIIAGKWLLPR